MAVGVVVAAVLAAGWTWWAARPAPPAVREEANALPVVWWSQGELHLEDVVVELPAVEEFVADGSGAVVRLRSGEVVRVAADGDVDEVDRCGRRRWRTRRRRRRTTPSGRYDVLVQSVPLPGGGWAHLIDSSRRDGAQDALRQSESGRRALVVCSAGGGCGRTGHGRRRGRHGPAAVIV